MIGLAVTLVPAEEVMDNTVLTIVLPIELPVIIAIIETIGKLYPEKRILMRQNGDYLNLFYNNETR